MWELMNLHRPFFIKETMMAMIINALISLAIAYITFRSQTQILLWGPNGLFSDLIPTIVIMLFCMALLMTLITRKRIEKGTAPSAPWHRKEHALFRWLPGWAIFRAIAFSILGLIVFLPTTTGLLALYRQFPASLTEVLVFKTCFGGVVAGFVAPFILIGAMADKGGCDCLESEVQLG